MEQSVAGRKTGRLVLIDDVTDEYAEDAGGRAWLEEWRAKMRKRKERFIARVKRAA